MIIDVDFLHCSCVRVTNIPYHPLPPSFGSFLLLVPMAVAKRHWEKIQKVYKSIFLYTALFGVPLSHQWKWCNFFLASFLATTPKRSKIKWWLGLLSTTYIHTKPYQRDQLKQFCLIFSTYPFCEITIFSCETRRMCSSATDLAISDVKTETNFDLGDDGASCHNLLIIAIVLSNWCTLTWFDLKNSQIWTWQISINKPVYCKAPRVFESRCLQVLANTHAIIVVRLPLESSLCDKIWCKSEEVTIACT